MLEPTSLLLTHTSQREALLYLLRRYPAGVTRSQLAGYWYRTPSGKTTCLGWEARNRLSELRKDFHIEHISLSGESAWVLRGPKREGSGQLTLALA